jgi:hypothetical protein
MTWAGVDFKVKMAEVGGKKIKMTIWDTGEGGVNPGEAPPGDVS